MLRNTHVRDFATDPLPPDAYLDPVELERRARRAAYVKSILPDVIRQKENCAKIEELLDDEVFHKLLGAKECDKLRKIVNFAKSVHLDEDDEDKLKHDVKELARQEDYAVKRVTDSGKTKRLWQGLNQAVTEAINQRQKDIDPKLFQKFNNDSFGLYQQVHVQLKKETPRPSLLDALLNLVHLRQKIVDCPTREAEQPAQPHLIPLRPRQIDQQTQPAAPIDPLSTYENAYGTFTNKSVHNIGRGSDGNGVPRARMTSRKVRMYQI